jgi:hypothetical protein
MHFKVQLNVLLLKDEVLHNLGLLEPDKMVMMMMEYLTQVTGVLITQTTDASKEDTASQQQSSSIGTGNQTRQ